MGAVEDAEGVDDSGWKDGEGASDDEVVKFDTEKVKPGDHFHLVAN